MRTESLSNRFLSLIRKNPHPPPLGRGIYYCRIIQPLTSKGRGISDSDKSHAPKGQNKPAQGKAVRQSRERRPGLSFFLIFNVSFDSFNVCVTHRKRGVSILPMEFPISRSSRSFHPFRTALFDFFHDFFESVIF